MSVGDRNLLLALAQLEVDQCTGCGHPLSESTDPATMYTWQVDDRTCEACRVLEAVVENHNKEENRSRGKKFAVSRTKPAGGLNLG